MSPTQLSLRHLRKAGWLCAIVEKWNPHAKIRQDLFGFADICAVKEDEVVLVQTTTAGNMAAREAKIRASEFALLWLSGPARSIFLHGWAKRGPRGKKKVWTLKELDIL